MLQFFRVFLLKIRVKLVVELDLTGGFRFTRNAQISAPPPAGQCSLLFLGTCSHSPVTPHSGGAFRPFPQPSPSLSPGLAFILSFPFFHRQLNIDKSICSKRSALMLSSFWAVVHYCSGGNTRLIFTTFFPKVISVDSHIYFWKVWQVYPLSSVCFKSRQNSINLSFLREWPNSS